MSDSDEERFPEHKFTQLSCSTLESIKIPLHLDGDVGLFLWNCISYTALELDEATLHSVGLHDHTVAKVEKLMEELQEKIDPAHWKEAPNA